jgi:hypothetical protein
MVSEGKERCRKRILLRNLVSGKENPFWVPGPLQRKLGGEEL